MCFDAAVVVVVVVVLVKKSRRRKINWKTGASSRPANSGQQRMMAVLFM